MIYKEIPKGTTTDSLKIYADAYGPKYNQETQAEYLDDDIITVEKHQSIFSIYNIFWDICDFIPAIFSGFSGMFFKVKGIFLGLIMILLTLLVGGIAIFAIKSFLQFIS